MSDKYSKHFYDDHRSYSWRSDYHMNYKFTIFIYQYSNHSCRNTHNSYNTHDYDDHHYSYESDSYANSSNHDTCHSTCNCATACNYSKYPRDITQL